MAHVTQEMRIEAPPEKVFDLLADVGNEPAWNPDARSVKRVDSGPVGVGAEWVEVAKGTGEMKVRIAEYERPRHVRFAIEARVLTMSFAFDFDAVDGGTATRLSADADVSGRGVFKVISPVLGLVLKRTFEKRPAQIAAGVAAYRPPTADGGSLA